MRPFTKGVFLKYSQLEHIERVADVKHPIILEALLLQDLRTPQVEITTLADMPSGTSYAGFWVTRRSGGVGCRDFDDLDPVFESDTCDDLGQVICAFDPSSTPFSFFVARRSRKSLI